LLISDWWLGHCLPAARQASHLLAGSNETIRRSRCEFTSCWNYWSNPTKSLRVIFLLVLTKQSLI